MKGVIGIVGICMIIFLVIDSFATDIPDEKLILELPPSLVYADDDSTLLGQYSNVGKKGLQLAPYFCASLEEDLEEILSQKDENGKFIYRKRNGEQYDLYEDELRVYTTLNSTLQEYAEDAVRRHLSEDLQPAFSENNAAARRFPFSNTYNGVKVKDRTIETIMNRARRNSRRYAEMEKLGYSENQIKTSFNAPVRMRVFSWDGEIDTLMTPNDSIRYYKNFIRSGLISIEPSTGYVKAWVGGIDHEHFSFDIVRKGRRQIGHAIKPFVYATGFCMGVAEPCTVLDSEKAYCVDPCNPGGKRWCPSGVTSRKVKHGFRHSPGVGVPMISLMGSCSGPQSIAKLFKQMNINIPEDQIVPSISLGTPDVSLYRITAAYAIFVNDGRYVTPQTIRRIEDKEGNVIYSSRVNSKWIINEICTYDVLQMMKEVVTAGTSTSLRWHKKWGGITHPTAGKTGTTQGNSDMWYFGLTPDLVTGVWTGGEDKQIRFRSMLWGQGARASLPIYGYYMQSVYADSSLNISTEDFKAPPSYPPDRFNCEDEKNGEFNPLGV